MKEENAIEVRNVTKKFKVYLDKGHTIKEKVLFSSRRKYEERVVLDGISFDVKRGEAIGLIGKNGCGKSTTLKLLTKIMYPDSGTIEMRGRVSSLIELGAGFHPDMSGRQNIYTNASIFGLTRKEIDDRLDSIIEFSELENFIDNPVRTYSSGMYMRLAFSVAINVDADILLIDEILAVGDANFQAKCFERLRKIKNSGTTIVIVSHAMGQIEQICDRSIWINDGKIKAMGESGEIGNRYLDYVMNGAESIVHETASENAEQDIQEEVIENPQDEPEIIKELGNKFVTIASVYFEKEGRRISNNTFKPEDSVTLVMEYKRNNQDITEAVFGIRIYRDDRADCYGTNTFIDNKSLIKLENRGKIKCVFESMQLLQGKYSIDVATHNEYGQTYHHISDAIEFRIYNTLSEVGITRINHKWEVAE